MECVIKLDLAGGLSLIVVIRLTRINRLEATFKLVALTSQLVIVRFENCNPARHRPNLIRGAMKASEMCP